MAYNQIQSIELAERLIQHDAIQQTQPHERVSTRYGFVPTTRLINIMRDAGWVPSSVTVAGGAKYREHAKHMIRFVHRDSHDMRLEDTAAASSVARGWMQSEEIASRESTEIVLVNDHKGDSAFKLYLGIFRLICWNGLVLGDTFGSYSIRHLGYTDERVTRAISSMLELAPKAAAMVGAMKSRELTTDERLKFAQDALRLRFDAKTHEGLERDIVRPNRRLDSAHTLWNVFNTYQENIIGGGIRAQNIETREIRRAPPVKAIDMKLDINRGLWNLAESYLN